MGTFLTKLTKSRNGTTLYFFDAVFEFEGFFFEGKR